MRSLNLSEAFHALSLIYEPHDLNLDKSDTEILRRDKDKLIQLHSTTFILLAVLSHQNARQHPQMEVDM